MARRTIVVDSYIWEVYPAGRIAVYGKDEFGLSFDLGTLPRLVVIVVAAASHADR